MSYRVYAVRYAVRDAGTRSADFYMGDPHDGPHPLAYYVWAIVGDEGDAYVVDAGFTRETSERRSGDRTLTCDPIKALAMLGIDVSTQKDVILTHLHYDHVGHCSAFPLARFWVQEQEMAFWTGRFASREGYRWLVEPADILGLVHLNFDRRIRFVNGDAEVTPGITLHRVGGHSPGLQVVRIETAGGPILLASDVAHFYENFDADRPMSIVHSLADMYAAFDAVRSLVDSPRDIVPGHDPLVLERYPAAAPALRGHAAEILADKAIG